MKRIALCLVAVLGLSLIFTGTNKAQPVDFLVSATIPTASGITVTATEVDSATGVFGSAVSELNFDPMIFDPVNGIYLPDHFFAIDVGVTGGAGGADRLGDRRHPGGCGRGHVRQRRSAGVIGARPEKGQRVVAVAVVDVG